MTSTLKGIEPPLPTGTRTFPLPPTPSRTSSHSHQPPPRSWPRQPPTPKPTAPAHVNHREAAGPPQKKAKLEATAGSHVNGATATHPPALDLAPSNEPTPDVEQGRKASRVSRHPLVPLRPGGSQSLRAVQRNRPLAVERAARKDAVPVKAYVPEPPPCAPRYHEAGTCSILVSVGSQTDNSISGPADFSPWTGHHAEDVLNELTTRQGFYDKIQVSQNESGTARPSVWSSLKHKSGLQILSSLFVSALDQRQCHGSITANSTFKPPPRVTLTDTKREAWLRDLANPLIPLRRLSRTIPHGIRGRILLDHCLSKDIPTSRAIWLAKCVGANEIRAFKRKGTGGVFTVGGEAKWIKDWTANIEQFLESIVVSCGSPGWRMKMNYGYRCCSQN